MSGIRRLSNPWHCRSCRRRGTEHRNYHETYSHIQDTLSGLHFCKVHRQNRLCHKLRLGTDFKFAAMLHLCRQDHRKQCHYCHQNESSHICIELLYLIFRKIDKISHFEIFYVFVLNITDSLLNREKSMSMQASISAMNLFFVSLQKETHETYNSQRNKNINTQ